VQESSAAAEGMRQQAEALVRAVGTFRLSTEDRMGGAPTLSSPDAAAPSRAPALAVARSVAVRPKSASAVPATAAGDDWEEF